MDYTTLPEFEELIDRLDFATVDELGDTATLLAAMSLSVEDRGTREILLTLRALFESCARRRQRELDDGLRKVIEAGDGT